MFFFIIIISGIKLKKDTIPFRSLGTFDCMVFLLKEKKDLEKNLWNKQKGQVGEYHWLLLIFTVICSPDCGSWNQKKKKKDFCRILFPVLSKSKPSQTSSPQPIPSPVEKDMELNISTLPLCTANIIWITYCLLWHLFGWLVVFFSQRLIIWTTMSLHLKKWHRLILNKSGDAKPVVETFYFYYYFAFIFLIFRFGFLNFSWTSASGCIWVRYHDPFIFVLRAVSWKPSVALMRP